MGVLDFHKCRMTAAPDLHNDVEGGDILNQLTGAEALRKQRAGLLAVCIGDPLQYGQLPVGVSADDAKNGGNVDAAQSSRIRNGDAHDVFDNVSAAVDGASLGYCAEQLARFGGGIGDGDRLGAAEGDNQLGFQNGKIVLTEEFLHCSVLSMYEGI